MNHVRYIPDSTNVNGIYFKKNVEELKRHVEYLEECQKLYPSKDNFNYLD